MYAMQMQNKINKYHEYLKTITEQIKQKRKYKIVLPLKSIHTLPNLSPSFSIFFFTKPLFL